MTLGARRVFGLGVWSDETLQSLEDLPAAPTVDVTIRLHSVPASLADVRDADAEPAWYVSPYVDTQGRPMVTAHFADEGRYIRLRYREGTEFILDRAGTEITATRIPESLTPADLTGYAFGPVMGLLLRLRGVTCLHASAIDINGHAVIFVGVEGSGKSTLAAALAARGHAVVSDDIVPLEERPSGFVVHPGAPRLRLWPASVEALSDQDPSESWRDAPDGRRYNLGLRRHGYRFRTESLPVGVIYLIGRDGDVRRDIGAAPVAPREALMALVKDTFAARLLDRSARAREFDTLARLVGATPVRRLGNGGSLARLPELSAFVEQDVEHISDLQAAAPGDWRHGAGRNAAVDSQRPSFG